MLFNEFVIIIDLVFEKLVQNLIEYKFELIKGEVEFNGQQINWILSEILRHFYCITHNA